MRPFLFITDLDNTLVGDDGSMGVLNDRLASHRQQFGTTLVYSTGRSPILYQQLAMEKPLLQPDILVCAVGTEIYYRGQDCWDRQWSDLLSQDWDRELIVAIAAHFADLAPQPESEQRPFKVSYCLSPTAAQMVVPELAAKLGDRGLDVQLVYSGNQDLDILPQRANKGAAMSFLRQQLGMAAEQTIACGDSGNDLAMFRDRPERGVIVGNAQPELLHWHHANPNPNRYLASAVCAAGILEGLQYFGFL
jgi:hypothetical protein